MVRTPLQVSSGWRRGLAIETHRHGPAACYRAGALTMVVVATHGAPHRIALVLNTHTVFSHRQRMDSCPSTVALLYLLLTPRNHSLALITVRILSSAPSSVHPTPRLPSSHLARSKRRGPISILMRLGTTASFPFGGKIARVQPRPPSPPIVAVPGRAKIKNSAAWQGTITYHDHSRSREAPLWPRGCCSFVVRPDASWATGHTGHFAPRCMQCTIHIQPRHTYLQYARPMKR